MVRIPWRGTVGRRVPGSGPLDAEVCILAEAPGSDEEDAGVPLIGPSGKFLFSGEINGTRLEPWPGLDRLGLGRKVVRCENVIEVRPPDNDLDTVSLASMEKWRGSLADRLAALPNLRLLVPTGNCALNAVLNSPLKQRKKRGGGREWVWPHTISAWRGSVNEIEIAGRTVTMIPTFHPAHFLYGEGANFQAWRADWLKVKRAVEGGITINPVLNTIVAPTWEQIATFGKLIQHAWHRFKDDALLAFDIETIGELIDCVGWCVDGETTLTLPLLPQLWPNGAKDVRRAYATIAEWLGHPIPKGTHWGYFDVFRLERQKGMTVRKWWWDSYNLHHLLDPADEHRLAYCVSRDLDVPYWKHESKLDRKGPSRALKADWHRRHAYCGKDTGYTWHLIRTYVARLRRPWEPVWQIA